MSDNLRDEMAKRISEVLRIMELAQPGMESLVAATLADALIPLIRYDPVCHRLGGRR